MNFDILSENKENQAIHHYCLLSKNYRYDVTIVYSAQFFGKAMVTSLQNGRMILMCAGDIPLDQNWVQTLGIEQEDIPEFQDFLKLVLQSPFNLEQY
ncbi:MULTISPECIES: SAV0927 family protein [Peribacillus]|uniref:Protein dltD n=1 Tax=Peribacillus simplex TaxID=1478 RepID=A0A109MSE7_9BACI|nr:SAV0927 family protein [Peribacillus simplex]KWW11257.1 protein dltD precursor [Peribacillus simplex]